MNRLVRSAIVALAGAAFSVTMSSCSGTVVYNPPATGTSTQSGTAVGSFIKHVVIIVQENRSFDNMFAGWPGADAPMFGYELVNKKRVRIPLQQMTYAENVDMCHLWADAHIAYDKGKMDGFNLERQFAAPNCKAGTIVDSIPYRYMDHPEIAPYRDLASQYVLADHMFPTEFGTSFTAHQDLIAGTTHIDADRWEVNTPTLQPWGCDAPKGTTTNLVDGAGTVFTNGPFPCFTQYPTIADTLGAKRIPWKYYAPPLSNDAGGLWTAFDAIRKVRYGPDWKNVTTPETTALKDYSKGDLPAVSWVIPDLRWADYPVIPNAYGPSWVGDLVNAIGKSKDWNSTAIIIVWDDWGGFYDNVPPPQLDSVGLAIRVPCLVVSPYAKKNYVSHTQYEYGSILKFIEQTFAIGSLHSSDVRANSLVDSFDFTQRPRRFVPIRTRFPASFFLSQAPSMRPPDDN
jgi:phospholipase C